MAGPDFFVSALGPTVCSTEGPSFVDTSTQLLSTVADNLLFVVPEDRFVDLRVDRVKVDGSGFAQNAKMEEHLRAKGQPDQDNDDKRGELVIQGSHMVSGTRCPAWSDQLKKWSESRAAAPKGRCPVEHRGEFPYVLRGAYFRP